MLFQTLKTLIVIAHLRSEKNFANALDLAGLVNPAIGPLAYLISYWLFKLMGHNFHTLPSLPPRRQA